jgi:hypothetical protein
MADIEDWGLRDMDVVYNEAKGKEDYWDCMMRVYNFIRATAMATGIGNTTQVSWASYQLS